MVRKFTLSRISKYDRVEVIGKKSVRKYEKMGYKRQPRRRRGKYVLKKEKEGWVQFEEEIRSFLDALGFNDVGGGVLGCKVDAYGGLEGTFLIIDCTTKKEPGFRSLESKIDQINGRKSDIEKAVQSKFKGYREIKFIIATKGIDVSEKNENEAERKGITIWSEMYLDLYKSLFKQVGPLVAYWILKELKAKPKRIRDRLKKPYYRINAFRIKEFDKTCFNFLMDADRLTKIGYVSRLLVGPRGRGAYQRALYPNKIRSIAKFIEDGGSFQNNVLISLEKSEFYLKKQLSRNIGFGILRIPKIRASAWTIDGQHRIYGFAKANSEYSVKELAVTAFENLDEGEQAKMYVTINKTQKPVEANDLWDLFPRTYPWSKAAWTSQVVKELNRRGRFKDQIYVPSMSKRRKKSYKINLFSFCEGMENTKLWDYIIGAGQSRVSPERFEPTVKRAQKSLNKYFKFIYEIGTEIDKKWNEEFFFTNNGLNVMLIILGDLISHPNVQKIPKRKEIEDILKGPLEAYCKANVKKINRIFDATFSYSGRDVIAAAMGEIVARRYAGFGGEKVEKLKKTPEFEILRELEGELRKCIVNNLSRLSKNWWKERVPEDVQKNAGERKEREEELWPEMGVDLISWVNFSEYRKIILRKNNWREAFKNIFKDEEFISTRLKELEDIRNAIMHFRRPLSDDEETKLRLFSREILMKIQKSR